MFKCVNKDKNPQFRLLMNAIEGLNLVRMEGLEPPCLTALDPKSSASTNFATSAVIENGMQKYNKYLYFQLIKDFFNAEKLADIFIL